MIININMNEINAKFFLNVYFNYNYVYRLLDFQHEIKNCISFPEVMISKSKVGFLNIEEY